MIQGDDFEVETSRKTTVASARPATTNYYVRYDNLAFSSLGSFGRIQKKNGGMKRRLTSTPPLMFQ
jgi:hypothetical protein